MGTRNLTIGEPPRVILMQVIRGPHLRHAADPTAPEPPGQEVVGRFARYTPPASLGNSATFHPAALPRARLDHPRLCCEKRSQAKAHCRRAV